MVNLLIPDPIESALHLPAINREKELVQMLSVKLYEDGVLGMGKAAELSNLSRTDFIARLDKEGIPLNYDNQELDRDISMLDAFR